MKKKGYLITIIFMLLMLTACSKKEYVVFKYNCKSMSDYKCELKNNKLNCDVKYPTCEGYEFLGWYDSKENGKEVNLYSEFKNKDIIYVHWKEKEEPSIEEESTLVEEQSSYIEEQSSLIEEPSSQKKYTITFNLNGGLGFLLPQDVEYNGTLPSISTIPTRTGYTFMGWYDNAKYEIGTQYYNSTNIAIKKYDKESNVTLYAGWKANTYTISFNANGGSGNSPLKNVTYDGILPNIGSIPSREGYTFLGWYDAKTDGTQYYNEKNVAVIKKYTKTSNITLYARWRENVLSIRYNTNGGTWRGSSNKYSLNVDGTVIDKIRNEIYEQKLKYGEKLDSNGLIDYNGTIFNWKKTGYYAETGKEYIISKTVLNQNAQYPAKQLAEYNGCDLSKKDCTITIKVNWKYVDFIITYLGDSRTNAYRGLKWDSIGFDSSKEKIVAKDGLNYVDSEPYFQNVISIINNNPNSKHSITVNLGTNDIHSKSSYCVRYKRFVANMAAKNSFFIVSVTPLDEEKNPWHTNKDFDEFNIYMRDTCIPDIKANNPNKKVYYCDVSNSLPMSEWEKLINPRDKHGEHYTDEGSTYIYNKIKECVYNNQ